LADPIKRAFLEIERYMSEESQIIAASLLDTWIAHEWSNGIQLASLKDLTEIHVQTRNSVYEIILIDHHSGEILVRGRQFFVERTAAYLEGSSRRGSFIKSGTIYVGLNLEIRVGRRRIVTSTVQSIMVTYPATECNPLEM
jgi:hypothetical protein